MSPPSAKHCVIYDVFFRWCCRGFVAALAQPANQGAIEFLIHKCIRVLKCLNARLCVRIFGNNLISLLVEECAGDPTEMWRVAS